MSRRGEPELAAGDGAARGLDAAHRAVLDANPGDGAVLQNVDAARVGGAGKTPGDRVVAHRAAAPLQESAADRKARIVEIEERHHAAHRVAIEELDVDAMHAHGVAAPRKGVALA